MHAGQRLRRVVGACARGAPARVGSQPFEQNFVGPEILLPVGQAFTLSMSVEANDGVIAGTFPAAVWTMLAGAAALIGVRRVRGRAR